MGIEVKLVPDTEDEETKSVGLDTRGGRAVSVTWLAAWPTAYCRQPRG